MKYFIENIDGSKTLLIGIALFIVLNLSALSISYWTAHQSDQDAVKINISGRQRMLTQRMTKALLLTTDTSIKNHDSYVAEFFVSALLFDETLFILEHGGVSLNSNGIRIVLDSELTDETISLLAQANHIWRKTHETLSPYMKANSAIPDEVLIKVREDLLGNNTQLLDLMNRLTANLEQESRSRLNTLRALQTTIFLMALVNFVVIVRRFHLLAWRVRLENAKNSELAMRDHLTGLFNRRHFQDILKRELRTADRRHSRRFVVFLVDLDGFKTINDTYGHDAGDSVLKTISSRLTQHARDNDTVARIGGDEFALICPYLGDECDADKFCERLITSINEPIGLYVGQLKVGASIGYAFYPALDITEVDIMKMADLAMYAAKNAGKNRYANFNRL